MQWARVRKNLFSGMCVEEDINPAAGSDAVVDNAMVDEAAPVLPESMNALSAVRFIILLKFLLLLELLRCPNKKKASHKPAVRRLLSALCCC